MPVSSVRASPSTRARSAVSWLPSVHWPSASMHSATARTLQSDWRRAQRCEGSGQDGGSSWSWCCWCSCSCWWCCVVLMLMAGVCPLLTPHAGRGAVAAVGGAGARQRCRQASWQGAAGALCRGAAGGCRQRARAQCGACVQRRRRRSSASQGECVCVMQGSLLL
jgi:hypothetical protein